MKIPPMTEIRTTIVDTLDMLDSVCNRLAALQLAIHSTDLDLDKDDLKPLDQLCIDSEVGLSCAFDWLAQIRDHYPGAAAKAATTP